MSVKCLASVAGAGQYPFSPSQGWGNHMESVLGYKYIKNVQVQVQVHGFAECTWVLPKYIANVLGYNYQVPSTNV